MAYAVLLALALLFGIFQHSCLSFSPLAPDLPLALAAWAMVDGTEEGVLLRAWLIGLCGDLTDPASTALSGFDLGACFHTICYLLLAMIFLPLRGFLFRGRITGWAAWAMLSYLLLNIIDRWRSGGGDGGLTLLLANGVLTGLVAIPLGWALNHLPRRLHPIGEGGA